MRIRSVVPFVVLVSLYGSLTLIIVSFRGTSIGVLSSCLFQALMGVIVLAILEAFVSTATADEIEGYYTTAANALIGLGMIISALTIVRATSHSTTPLADRILATAPMALAATACGLAGGIFFFVAGHLRASSRRVRMERTTTSPSDRGLTEAITSLVEGLSRHGRHLEEMSQGLDHFERILGSAGGQSWIDLQTRMVEPLGLLASSTPVAIAALHQSSREIAELNSAMPALRDVLETSRDVLRKHGGSLGATETALTNLSAAASALERAIGATTSAYMENARATQVLHEGTELQTAAVQSLTSAVNDATTVSREESAALRKQYRESTQAVVDCEASLVAGLRASSEAVTDLRIAVTDEQRGLLDKYLEGLGTSAEKIAAQALQHLPQHIEAAIEEVEQRILATVEKAFIRAYGDASLQFSNLNGSASATAERIRALQTVFDEFCQATDRFDKAVRIAASSASSNGGEFEEAARRLSEVMRQFTSSVAAQATPEHVPLLGAMGKTAEDLTRAADSFRAARETLLAEQARLSNFYASLSVIRADAARLRIKGNGTA